MEEFWVQGDKEAAMGLAVSPFMDRRNTDVAKCQSAFIKYVVLPLVELASTLNPNAAKMLKDNLNANGAAWNSQSPRVTTAVDVIRTTIDQSTIVISTVFSDIVVAIAGAARYAEHALSMGYIDHRVGLADLTYSVGLNGSRTWLSDARPTRHSEFSVDYGVMDVEYPWPPLAESGAATCACREDWEAFCNRTASLVPAGRHCITCPVACEVQFGMQLSAVLDPVVQAVAPSAALLSAWYWARGNGTDSRDWNRLWIVSNSNGDYSLAAANTTMQQVLLGNANVWFALPRSGAFNRTPRWMPPYIDEITQLPVTTIEVPAYTNSGQWLGSMYADMLMANSRYILSNLTPAFDIECVMSMTDGDIVSASSNAFEMLFPGKCVGVICNIFALVPPSADMVAPAWEFNSYNVVTVSGSAGGQYLLFLHHARNSEWLLWYFVPKDEAFPPNNSPMVISLSVCIPVVFLVAAFALVITLVTRHLRGQVVEMEQRLGSMASTLGTAAEDVIKTLLRFKNRRGLSKKERGDLVDVIALIATNKIFSSDTRKLKQRLGAMQLDSDVDAYLLDVLAQDGAQAQAKRKAAAEMCNKDSQGSGVTSLAGTKVRVRSSEVELRSVKTVFLPDGRVVPLESWECDVEALQPPEGVSLLETVAISVMDAMNLIDTFELSRKKARKFMHLLEKGYNEVPYHTSLHAADVIQAMYSLMCGCVMQFTPLEQLAAVLAAAIHDYNHPGLNNNFMCATFDPVFLRYNGISVLESMHCAKAFKILLSKDCNFLSAKLSHDDTVELHRMVVQLVLHTDMAKHLETTSQFSARVASGNLDSSRKADRLLCLQVLLKVADVSNPARAWIACKRWADRVMEEFWLQGDKEATMGLAVSPFMDRRNTDVAKCQSAFIKYVVLPLVELAATINPAVAKTLRDNLNANAAAWRSLSVVIPLETAAT
eukprot:m51a1_g2142 putative protein pde- isoform a (939) ;mRNA; f:104-4126